MSIALRVLTIAAIAGLAFAQCPTVASSNNLFRSSTCAGYSACEATLCSCVGSSGNTDTCLSNVTASASCTTFTSCTVNFMNCLYTLTQTARVNSTDPCNSWAMTVYTAELNAAMSTYAGSTLQSACIARTCALLNVTGISGTCSFGTNYTNVCMAPPNTTVAAVVTTAPTYLVSATLSLGGNFVFLFASTSAQATFKADLAADIAKLLGLSTIYISIGTLTPRRRQANGSNGVTVVFYVLAGAPNVTAASLVSIINAQGTSTSWLTSTAAFATANGATLTVTGLSGAVVTTTLAPGAATSTSSAASVCAGLIAALAMLALAF